MKKAVEKETVRRPAPRSAPERKPAPGPVSIAQPDLDIEDAIPYLVARAGMRMGQAFSKQLRAFDLNLTEWRVFAALNHKPHQRLSDLALHTSAEPSTLSRVVDGLIQRKLLVRDRNGEDARAVALSLTPVGVELAQRIIPLAEIYERVALAGIPKQNVDSLKDMLRKIYNNMAMLDIDD